jgi:hypothetical protein
LVRDAWNAPRTTIHRGDQAMRELHRVATGLPPEIAADLVVAAAPEFVDYSKYTVRHDKDKPAIFSSNDRVLVSMPSPGEEASKPGPEASKPNPNVEASNRALTLRLQSRALTLLTLRLQSRTPTLRIQSRPLTLKLHSRTPMSKLQNRALTLKRQCRNMRSAPISMI